MTGRVALASVLAAVVVAAGLLVLGRATTTAPSAHEHGAARAICTGADTLDINCRVREYTALAEAAGVEQALARLREERRTDGVLRIACHEIVHHLGHAEGARDGAVATAYARGSPMCSGGYYHGATEAVMVTVGLPAAGGVCAEVAAAQPRSLTHLWCAHGMGHGYVELLDGDVFGALAACDGLPGWEAQHCYGGVFMENVTSLADPAGPSRFLRAEDPLHPCPSVPERQKAKCYEKQTAFALYQHNGDLGPGFALCAAAPDAAFRPVCNQGLGDRAVVRSEKLLITEEDKAAAIGAMCGLGPDPAARAECLLGAVGTVVRHGIGDGIADRLCAAVTDPALHQRCGQTVLATVREYREAG